MVSYYYAWQNCRAPLGPIHLISNVSFMDSTQKGRGFTYSGQAIYPTHSNSLFFKQKTRFSTHSIIHHLSQGQKKHQGDYVGKIFTPVSNNTLRGETLKCFQICQMHIRTVRRTHKHQLSEVPLYFSSVKLAISLLMQGLRQKTHRHQESWSPLLNFLKMWGWGNSLVSSVMNMYFLKTLLDIKV